MNYYSHPTKTARGCFLVYPLRPFIGNSSKTFFAELLEPSQVTVYIFSLNWAVITAQYPAFSVKGSLSLCLTSYYRALWA